jgi:propionyl-CoA carboxylase beta chain
MTDFTMMVEDTSYVRNRSNVGKTVTNETVTSEVGGASTHATKSGVAHYFYQ